MNILTFSFELAQELYNSSSEFPVDFELAWKWLGFSTKGNAKRTLVKNFVENEDFWVIHVEKSEKSSSRGGLTHREDIWLTTNCLKEMGMIAGSLQGKAIRKYFLQCEAIAKQAVEVISTIQESITQLLEENKQLRLLVTQNQQAIALTTQSVAQLESKIEPLLPSDPNKPAPGWTQENWKKLPPQDKRHFRFLYKRRGFQPSDQGQQLKALPSTEMQEHKRMQKTELDAIIDVASIPLKELASLEERKRKLLEQFNQTE